MALIFLAFDYEYNLVRIFEVKNLKNLAIIYFNVGRRNLKYLKKNCAILLTHINMLVKN